MPSFAPRRLLPFRDRQALLDRHRELDTAANQVDSEQRRLAVEFSSLRGELRTVRDKLWPAGLGRAFRATRRPRLPGPSPIPRPVEGAQPIRGRALRYAALAVLARSGTALPLPEIHRALHLRGFVISGQHPVKTLG